jgi:hypothetical protein
MHTGNRAITPGNACATIGCPSSPNGLRTPGWPGKSPGLILSTTLAKTITAPESQASGRHLLDGSFPSGNRRIR